MRGRRGAEEEGTKTLLDAAPSCELCVFKHIYLLSFFVFDAIRNKNSQDVRKKVNMNQKNDMKKDT